MGKDGPLLAMRASHVDWVVEMRRRKGETDERAYDSHEKRRGEGAGDELVVETGMGKEEGGRKGAVLGREGEAEGGREGRGMTNNLTLQLRSTFMNSLLSPLHPTKPQAHPI